MTSNTSIKSDHGSHYDGSGSVIRGVSWAVLMRWLMRFIGLFSTLILARVLSPDDFGVVALAMLVASFLFELSEFGTSMHLIRAKHIDRQHCDTAWTITLLQACFTAAVLFALAIPASAYFNEPRMEQVMYVLALASLIAGFENIEPVLARRDLKFALDFRFNIYKKCLVFVATVASAFIFRNYWALVVGHLVGTLASVSLSFILFSYRPRWSLAHAAQFMRFGLSIIPMRLAMTLRGMAPSLFVASMGNTSELGMYRMAKDLSDLFTNEIVTPMGRGLLPNYVRLADKPDELSAIYCRILGLVAMVCMPIGAGVAAVSHDLTLVLLGPQWTFSAVIMQYLAIGAAIFAISRTMVSQILVATGRERTASVLAWVRLLITVPILWAGVELDGIIGLAKATIVAGLVCLPVIYSETRRAINLPLVVLLALLWRPLIGACAMYFTVEFTHSSQLEWAIVRLMQDVLVGAVSYIVVTLVLWLLSGKPKSAESFLVATSVRIIRLVRGKIFT